MVAYGFLTFLKVNRFLTFSPRAFLDIVLILVWASYVLLTLHPNLKGSVEICGLDCVESPWILCIPKFSFFFILTHVASLSSPCIFCGYEKIIRKQYFFVSFCHYKVQYLKPYESRACISTNEHHAFLRVDNPKMELNHDSYSNYFQALHMNIWFYY